MLQTAGSSILVADECWVALAELHRAYPQRSSFTAREILDQIKQEHAHGEIRQGLTAHIYQHNVANVAPSSARYRMFYRLPDGTLRLFRPGDDADASRRGKITPSRSDLPERYHHLLDWYEQKYAHRKPRIDLSDDPIFQMVGLGKEIWQGISADEYVAEERSGWEDQGEAGAPVKDSDWFETAWQRIKAQEGAEFRTITGKPFTYIVHGNSGLRFDREGKNINMFSARSEVKKAVARCPLSKVTELADLRNPAYLYGVLMNPKIRRGLW